MGLIVYPILYINWKINISINQTHTVNEHSLNFKEVFCQNTDLKKVNLVHINHIVNPRPASRKTAVDFMMVQPLGASFPQIIPNVTILVFSYFVSCLIWRAIDPNICRWMTCFTKQRIDRFPWWNHAFKKCRNFSSS